MFLMMAMQMESLPNYTLDKSMENLSENENDVLWLMALSRDSSCAGHSGQTAVMKGPPLFLLVAVAWSS